MIVEQGKLFALAGNDAVNGARASAVCLSITDGSLIWRHDIVAGESFAWRFSRYSQSSNAIYYATQSSHVVALSKVDGSVVWDSPNAAYNPPVNIGVWQGSPTYRNGIIYVGAGINPVTPGMQVDGSVVALDASNGNLLWSKILPRPNSSTGYVNWQTLNDNVLQAQLVPTLDGLIVEPGSCVALMDSSGNLIWEKAPTVNGGLNNYDWPPLLRNGMIYGVNSGNGNYFCYSFATP
jgi:outer membrane protein assembly factor BamB